MASELLDLQRFFIKEQVAMLRTVDIYDIFNPDTQEHIGQAREEVSGLQQVLRWFVSKQLMSTTVDVVDADDRLVFQIHRPFTFWRAQVDVLDHKGRRLGYFKSKIFSLGGGFWVYNDDDAQFAEVKGDWKGWNFKFLTPDGTELGEVTKKWAGLGKELFTSADNYIVSIDDDLADQPVAKCLLLAAALAIDIVYKEHR
ncbi:MAG: hypothetical protein L0Y71_21635 [Gemmataceae bacterium]|nr:hypothetical protein [Gemmataceae bacterium]